MEAWGLGKMAQLGNCLPLTRPEPYHPGRSSVCGVSAGGGVEKETDVSLEFIVYLNGRAPCSISDVLSKTRVKNHREWHFDWLLAYTHHTYLCTCTWTHAHTHTHRYACTHTRPRTRKKIQRNSWPGNGIGFKGRHGKTRVGLLFCYKLGQWFYFFMCTNVKKAILEREGGKLLAAFSL